MRRFLAAVLPVAVRSFASSVCLLIFLKLLISLKCSNILSEMRELINIIRRLPAASQPVGLLQVSLSLQPLPSLRSVQWPALPPFVSLA